MKRILIGFATVLCIIVLVIVMAMGRGVEKKGQPVIKGPTLSSPSGALITKPAEEVEKPYAEYGDISDTYFLTHYRTDSLKPLTKEQADYLTEKGYYYSPMESRIYKGENLYYYPVLYTDEATDNIILYCSDERGTFWGIGIDEPVKDSWISSSSNVPEPILNSFVTEIKRTAYGSLVYNSLMSTVTEWFHFEARTQFKLPEESIYCGYSETENAFVFRAPNGDINILREKSRSLPMRIETIAHKVRMVITSSYDNSSDWFSVPLFLMEDGSVKAYIFDNSDKELDSEDFLQTPRVEGGNFRIIQFESGYPAY